MKIAQRRILVWLFVTGTLLSACIPVNPAKASLPALTPEASPIFSLPPATSAMPGDCKKITFVLSRNAVSDIYTVCPDGSGLVNLTNDPFSDSQPTWSPDGRKIAFASSYDGNSQIYIMDEDGNNRIQLTADAENSLPIWLPDGKRIAYRSTDGKGLWCWRIIDIEDHAVSQISEPSYDFFFQTPAWSPDGQYIAYMSLAEQLQRNDGSSQIHVKAVDGSSDIALTNDTWANINPAWSPDGTRIAFLSERDGIYNKYALYVMNRVGDHLQKLTEPVYSESSTVSWSPEEHQIAIGSDEPSGGIDLVDADGGNSTQVLNLPGAGMASSPSWQP